MIKPYNGYIVLEDVEKEKTSGFVIEVESIFSRGRVVTRQEESVFLEGDVVIYKKSDGKDWKNFIIVKEENIIGKEY